MRNGILGVFIVAVMVLTGCSNQDLQSNIEKEKAKADAIMAEAVALKMPTWVPNHYQTLQALYNTGQTYVSNEKYKKAKQALDQFYAYYDIAKADTLEAQEQSALKVADRDQLATQTNNLQKQLTQTRAQHTAERDKNRRLEAKISALESRVAQQTEAIESLKQAPTVSTYVVQRGDTLNSIAAQPTVYNDAKKWPLLYENNRDALDDPMAIYPGQVLQIVPEN
jgi:nucleoid-associated protein YgaU